MSKTYVVIARIDVYVAPGSATVVGLASGDHVIVSSSAFFPFLAASLRAANIGRRSLDSRPIKWITIPRNVESLCSSCFENCRSLSSISFEDDSRLKLTESKTFRDSHLK
jgi:hypothetical protein